MWVKCTHLHSYCTNGEHSLQYTEQFINSRAQFIRRDDGFPFISQLTAGRVCVSTRSCASVHAEVTDPWKRKRTISPDDEPMLCLCTEENGFNLPSCTRTAPRDNKNATKKTESPLKCLQKFRLRSSETKHFSTAEELYRVQMQMELIKKYLFLWN